MQAFYRNSKHSNVQLILAVLSVVLIISVILLVFARDANKEYYKRWPLEGDTASYWLRDIRLTTHIHDNSSDTGATKNHRFKALLGARQNQRDPIRTAFFSLLSAKAPYSVNGHLPFSICAVFIFFSFLITALYKRSNSLTYAIGVSLIALLPVTFLNPMYGLPSKLPDVPASLLFGAALFAMFSAADTKKSELCWTFTAGVLLGLATLTRYHVWIYGVFTLAPVAFILGCKHYLQERRNIFNLLAFPAVFFLGLGLIAGYFIAENLISTLKFYSTAGYALNVTVLTSIKSTGRQFLEYLGKPAILAILLIAASYTTLNYDPKHKPSKWDSISIAWALIAYPILLFGIMKVEAMVDQSYYVIPGLLISFLSPFRVNINSVYNDKFKIYAATICCIIPIFVYISYTSYLKSEFFLYPRPDKIEIAKFQEQLVDLVANNIKANSNVMTISSNFSYYERYVEPLLIKKHGLKSNAIQTFEIRQSQWKIGYTGTFAKDKALIIDALNKKVDIFIALTKPVKNKMPETFIDDYTESVAVHVNHEISQQTSNWRKIGVVEGPYGEVSIYRNTQRSDPA